LHGIGRALGAARLPAVAGPDTPCAALSHTSRFDFSTRCSVSKYGSPIFNARQVIAKRGMDEGGPPARFRVTSPTAINMAELSGARRSMSPRAPDFTTSLDRTTKILSALVCVFLLVVALLSKSIVVGYREVAHATAVWDCQHMGDDLRCARGERGLIPAKTHSYKV
jgi:hypothetical protein